MFKFTWERLATDEVVSEMLAQFPQTSDEDRKALKSAIVLSLKRLGGFPLSRVDLGEQECRDVVRHLLSQPLLNLSATKEAAAAAPEFEVAPSDIGALRGILRNKDERFKAPTPEARPISLAEPFAKAVQRLDETRSPRSDVLEGKRVRPQSRRSAIRRAAAAMVRGSTRTVAWQDQWEDRPNDDAGGGAAAKTRWVGILEDGEYYKHLPFIIGQAQRSIRLCMFHIVYSSPEHPTGNLLEALVAAKERGVKVQVLMDQDRKDDPYHSLVINTPAARFFAANGIECRLDESDALLHSKYLVIDEDKVVIGSHNWSAGSYFTYKDLSFVVESADLGRELAGRFEAKWRKSTNRDFADAPPE